MKRSVPVRKEENALLWGERKKRGRVESPCMKGSFFRKNKNTKEVKQKRINY